MLCDFDEVGLLRTDIEVEGPDTALILTGELDLCSHHPFWEDFSRAAAAATGRVILDLAGLAFLDAAGLRALEKAHRLMGDRLIVRRPSLAARRLLELSGLDHGLTIQMTPGKIAYVQGLWEACETGGASALARLVPDGVEWAPWQAGGRRLSGTAALQAFWSNAPWGSIKLIGFSQVGEHVIVHLCKSLPEEEPVELWSVCRFNGEQLVGAVSFADEDQALAYAA